MGFTFKKLDIPGLLIVEGRVFPDGRGFFLETYRERDLHEAGIPSFVQDNVSRSTKGALRGLHYQKKAAAQGKFVRCIRGRIFDVAVDIRIGSPTYGRWAAVELDDETNRALWIPPGFAHGFYTLSEVADVIYKVTDYYSPEQERGIIWNDPQVAVRWPGAETLLSPKDSRFPVLSQADNDFTWNP